MRRLVLALGVLAVGCVDGPVRHGPPPSPATLEVRSFVGDPLLAPAGQVPRIRVDDRTQLVRTTDHAVVRWGLDPGDWDLDVGVHVLPLRLSDGSRARWTAWPEEHLATITVHPGREGPPVALHLRGPECDAIVRWVPVAEDRKLARGRFDPPALLLVPNGWWGVTPLAADGVSLGSEETVLVRAGEHGAISLR